jgi:hypothetical protein
VHDMLYFGAHLSNVSMRAECNSAWAVCLYTGLDQHSQVKRGIYLAIATPLTRGHFVDVESSL